MQSNPSVETKVCSRCKQEKEITEFSSSKPAIRRKDTRCRRCRADQAMKRCYRLVAEGRDPNQSRKDKKKPKPARLIAPAGMRFCTRCKEAKPTDEFVSHYGTRDGKSERCRQCDKISQEEIRRRYWEAPATQPEIKYCCGCKQNKPRCEFHRCRGKRLAIGAMPRVCIREGKRARYGITRDQFLEMLESQGNACAICGTALDATLIDASSPLSPNIDHCHTSGKVRGVLCRVCNLTLGVAEHGGWLAKATEYLAVHKH